MLVCVAWAYAESNALTRLRASVDRLVLLRFNHLPRWQDDGQGVGRAFDTEAQEDGAYTVSLR